jgi:hypothetical protein
LNVHEYALRDASGPFFDRPHAAGFSFSLKTSSLSILDYRRCVAARLAVRKSFLRYLERGF